MRVAGDDEKQSSPREPHEALPSGVAVVGLTGGLAAGKSTALSMFAELGALTLASDDLVQALYRRTDVRRALSDRFGDRVFAGEAVDKRALGELVTRDPDALAWLERLVHPLVGDRLRAAAHEAKPGQVVVFEVPLLFETGLDDFFDLIVSIEAPLEVRRQRWAERPRAGLLGDLESRQLTSEERIGRADLSFANEGGLARLRQFVGQAYEAALRVGQRADEGAEASRHSTLRGAR
jgi:dephospho-CoA kinase